jgi:hypothetical protein
MVGLAIAIIGLASILQPFSIFLYSYGFYILVIGAATSFLGGTMPESASPGRAALQVASAFTILTIILALAILLAPILVE